MWLDCRGVPSDLNVSDQTGQWPNIQALCNVYNILPTQDRVVVSVMDFPLRSRNTPYWPSEDCGDSAVSTSMDGIHTISANLYFGNKEAMSRLARAQLILFERDLARGTGDACAKLYEHSARANHTDWF